jgi:hypothetical protein
MLQGLQYVISSSAAIDAVFGPLVDTSAEQNNYLL